MTLIVLSVGRIVKKISRNHQTMCQKCKRKSRFVP